MIRLRRTLERSWAHPVLGPILLIVVALLLAFLVVHAFHQDAIGAIGALCVAIVAVVGAALLELVPGRLARPVISARGDRGPPLARGKRFQRPIAFATGARSLPLRR